MYFYFHPFTPDHLSTGLERHLSSIASIMDKSNLRSRMPFWGSDYVQWQVLSGGTLIAFHIGWGW